MSSLKDAYRALDPARPLAWPEGKDLYVPRVRDAAGTFMQELAFSERERNALIIGQRGSGKSTELARFAAGLRPDAVVIQMAPGGGVYRPGVWGGLQNALEQAGISLESGGPWISAAFPEWVSGLNRRVVVLIDGLERLSPSDALSGAQELWGIQGVSVVASAPIDLLFDPRHSQGVAEFDRTIVLPALVLEDDTKYLKQIITKRVGTKIFTPDALTRLAEASGGLYREMLLLAQQACAHASLKGVERVGVDPVEAVLDQRRFDLAFTLSIADLEYLAEVDIRGRITQDPRALRLIHGGAILACDDGASAFRIHPLVAEIVEDHRARQSA